ncbi:hypothetical protein GCM10010218_27980 [Streptomyces mashuensis]|uniref:Uncharacterized protein n=1 Tax=Streptomyces mashuensis TaxID=33904 RepID=A0A919ED31_9ACTN|nr:hypothetical protein GCM10010218_27980 [Streptomyces mashuensis]
MRELGPFRHPVNLICAIAPDRRRCRAGPCGRGPSFRGSFAGAAPEAFPGARPHKKEIALDPAESSAIDDRPKSVGGEPVGAGSRIAFRACRAVELQKGDRRVGGPGITRSFSCQASLRCWGMPASRARTSASR